MPSLAEARQGAAEAHGCPDRFFHPNSAPAWGTALRGSTEPQHKGLPSNSRGSASLPHSRELGPHRAAPKCTPPCPSLWAAAGREGQRAWDLRKQISNTVASPKPPGSVHTIGYTGLGSKQFCSEQNIFLPSPRTISNASLKLQKLTLN